jgi:hypothetical protein
MTISFTQGKGLADLAAQLADLEALWRLTHDAKMEAQQQGKSLAGVYTPREIAASNDAHLLCEVNKRTLNRTDSLADVILLTEPRTLDETLSLALVYREAMSRYLNDVTENPESVKDDEMVERERVLDHTREAIIRGLVYGAGAKSPLLTSYACETEELVPWDEMRRKAEEAAARYPTKAPKTPKAAEEASE